MVKVKSFIEKFYVAFIGFLLYAPLLVLFVCSFNDSKARTIWGGFTFHWYTDLFQNEEVLSAVRTSLLLTTLAALIATLIGTLACIGMTAMKLRFQKVMEGLANIPLLNADIVTGVAIMLLFVHFILPGIISGIIMVFIPSISEFVVADILGGSKVLLFGNVIDQEFNVANNWNLGSGLSIVLMIFIFISMAIMNRHASEEGDNMLW